MTIWDVWKASDSQGFEYSMIVILRRLIIIGKRSRLEKTEVNKIRGKLFDELTEINRLRYCCEFILKQRKHFSNNFSISFNIQRVLGHLFDLFFHKNKNKILPTFLWKSKGAEFCNFVLATKVLTSSTISNFREIEAKF